MHNLFFWVLRDIIGKRIDQRKSNTVYFGIKFCEREVRRGGAIRCNGVYIWRNFGLPLCSAIDNTGCKLISSCNDHHSSLFNLQFVNDLHALISPTPQGTPLPLALLGKSKNALLSTFLFLDQFVWLGRTGIYQNKERTELIGRISLYCWLGSSVCATLVELGELGRLSASMKKLEKDLKNKNKYDDEQYRAKLNKSNERTLSLIKAGIDTVVAVGLLQLAPKTVTPRVTGAFGFVSSLISCYQLLPAPVKSKTV
ncbi:peroxisomal membrane protein 11 isoform X2 [Glycine max]|uniref:Peroxisomal membrane protein 11C isoform A n=1 Tax=Glycine soja TaxID=3848 RepID=A0A445J6J0_GLYSO|nr:peroxisomal membrane protein 11 isoform X2 [Glycine max]RZB94012.1 Peroxisomal membrane protein 11C isoform A [Glycine soja]RZB94013.1 Peroxisomal membrane protein 11C isoform B [Glycine soja]RZB94014.1 Peroxisomal membrane protein 11C isoform C [Glycine soja]